MTSAETAPVMESLCGAEREDTALIRSVLDRVGDKWSMLVIGMLEDGPKRFTHLHKAVPGISQRMLALTLRNLERDGLVSRTSYPEVPPRVEYEVTDLGRTLVEPVLGLARWASAHQVEIEGYRTRFDDAQA